MSNEFDRVLIHPARQALSSALQQATRTANDRSRLRTVHWPPTDLDAVLDRVEQTREGQHQWNGGDGRGRPGEVFSAVALVWWSDLIDRRHCRVVGRRGKLDAARLEHLLSPGEERPAVWLVYPDYFFRRLGRGRRELVALCACGRCGPADEIGWMGDRCNICYDHREEGTASALAWPDPRQATLSLHHGHLLFLSWSSDGRTIATGGDPGVIRLWDAASGREIATLTAGTEEWLLCAAFTPDGAGVFTGSNRGSVQCWDCRTGAVKSAFTVDGPVMCLAVSPDGKCVACADDRGAALYDAHAGKLLYDWRGSLPDASCLAFSPEGGTLACGSRLGTIKVWDVERGVERARLDRPGVCVAALAYSPDRQTLAIALHPPGEHDWADDPSGLLLWGVTRHHLKASLPGHATGTRCVAFAPDGRTLASGGDDRLVSLWDPAAGQQRAALEWHLDSVCSVAFAPDGQTLATASFDGTAKLWPREVLPV
jgi:WD40 repeat protein